MYLIKMDCLTKDEVLVEKIRDVVKYLIDNRELLHFSLQVQKEAES